MKNRSDQKNWLWHLMLVILGAGSATLGILAIRQGIWWRSGFNARLGRVGIAPTADLIGIGILLILIGIIPWERLAGWRKGSKR